MSAAGLANPSPAARSLSREVDRVRGAAWELLRGHEKRCQLCGERSLCALGMLLRTQWVQILDFSRTPSEWPTVEGEDP